MCGRTSDSPKNNNEIYELVCNRGVRQLYFPCTGIWEEVEDIWVDSVVGPIKAKLHCLTNESGADLVSDWDALPDYDEIARTALFNDGRYTNVLNAPPEIYPFLAQMLSLIHI